MDTLFEESGKKFLTMAPNEDSSVTWGCCVDKFNFFSKEEEDKPPTYVVESFLRISDCSKTVRLDFDVYDDSPSSKNKCDAKLEKLDTLISELNEYRYQLEKAYDIKLRAEAEV